MLKGSEERKGGGYLQREKRRKLEAEPMKQSSLAQYMVLKPPPLETPPNRVMYLLKSLRSLGPLRLEYFRILWH